MKGIFSRLPGFVLAGGVATVVNLGIYYLLIFIGLHHTLAATTGYFSGTGLAYWLNRVIVFRPDRPVRFAVLRYFVVDSLALIVLLLTLETLVGLGMTPAAANPVAVFVVFLLKYFAVRRLVFLKKLPVSESGN